MTSHPKLHVYAQPWEHGESWIVGERKALEALRDAIDSALRDGAVPGTSAATGYASDGEGYRVLVMRVDGEVWRDMLRPYTEDSARDNRDDATHPFALIDANRYRTLMRPMR